MPRDLRCPSCFQPVSRGDVQCPRCELLLEGQLDQPVPSSQDISVVKALMEAPQARAQRGPPRPPPELTPDRAIPARKRRVTAATKVFVMPPSLEEVPTVVASLRLAELNLTPFEAWAVSLIDGRMSGAKVQPASGLAPFEFQILLGTLVDKGVLTMAPPPQPKPAKPAPPPLKIIERFPVAPPPKDAPALAPKPKPQAARPVELAPPAQMVAAAPAQTTDPRIRMGEGVAKNRKLLDALKQVKRAAPAEAPTNGAPAATPARPPSGVAELASESALQVAIRMERDGRLPEAVRYLERAIARSPDAAPLYNRLAIILVRDRRDFREAERLMKKALQLEPENDVYKKNLVSILHAQAG